MIFKRVESSMIKKIGYSAEILGIMFNNGNIKYYLDVPYSTYELLMHSSSKGQYCHMFIFNKFDVVDVLPCDTNIQIKIQQLEEEVKKRKVEILIFKMKQGHLNNKQIQDSAVDLGLIIIKNEKESYIMSNYTEFEELTNKIVKNKQSLFIHGGLRSLEFEGYEVFFGWF